MTDSAFIILVEVLLSIILVIVVLGNLFVIIAVCRHVRLRTIPNICITSLAVADLFVGLVNIPMYMYAAYYDDEYSEEYDLALNLLDMYFGAATILHLAFISMERCYAITYPLRRRFLQKATVIKVLLFLWSAVTVPVVLYALKVPSAQAIILIGYFLIPLVVIITSYTALMISAKLSWKQIGEHRAQQSRKDIRLAKTLSIVIIVFIATWTPFFLVLFVQSYPEEFILNLSPAQIEYFAHFVKFSQYASSAFNPFIYAFRQREFKLAFYHLFQGSKHHSRLNGSLVREASPSLTRTTRSFFNRLSKAFDKNEHLSLHRTKAHEHGEKKSADGEQCLTQV